MTWTVTDRGSVSGAAGSGNIVIPSFTPAASSLLLLAVARSSDGTVSSVSGHGTWSLVTTIDDISGAGRNRDLEIWGCRVGASPSASAVTISRTYIYRCDAQVTDISETAGLNGSSVADALGTGDSDSGYNLGTYTASLAAFADADNLTFVACMGETTYTGTVWTPDTGYTELAEWDSASTNFNNAIHYYANEDTSPSATCATGSIGAGIWAVEVKHAAASGVTGTGAATTPIATASGAGNIANPADVYDIGGNQDLLLPFIAEASGSGTLISSVGSGAPSSFLPTLAGVGSVAQAITGTGVPTTILAVINGVGLVAETTITGTGSIILPMPTAYSASGDEVIERRRRFRKRRHMARVFKNSF